MNANLLFEQLNEANDKLLRQTIFSDKCLQLLERYRSHLIYFNNNCKCNENFQNKLIINDLENQFKFIHNERHPKTSNDFNENINQEVIVPNIIQLNSYNYNNNNVNHFNNDKNTDQMSYDLGNELSEKVKSNRKTRKSAPNKRRKIDRKVQKKGRRSDEIRDAILSGQQHESHRKNKVIASRYQCIDFECKCKVKCHLKFTEEQKKFVFQQFYSFKSHSQQYLYLKGLVTPKVEPKAKKYKMFEYFIEVPDIHNKTLREKVCQKAFLNLLGLKKSELRKKIQIDRRNSDDNRGKHHNRANRRNTESKKHKISDKTNQ